jgi:tripartite-type tricarboxylate transporter receptor subunit TctC
MAAAQAYPAQSVRLLVGFPAGGPNDILGRLIAQWLSGRLGQPFVVENRPGGSGNIATETVVRAPADGYMLLLVGPANAIGASLYPNLGFNFLRDIAPVAGITREPLVLVVHPSVPAKTVPELIAHAKANPGTIKMATTGNGSSPHVSGVLFKMMVGLDLMLVPYAGGGPALKDLIAGQAHELDVVPEPGAERFAGPIERHAMPVGQGELRRRGGTSVRLGLPRNFLYRSQAEQRRLLAEVAAEANQPH